jgi:hypothetical protein
MFSGRVGTPALVVITACAAALLLVGAFESEEAHARSVADPRLVPGDPDEFESRVSEGGAVGAGKPSLCGDPASQECQGDIGKSALSNVRIDEEHGAGGKYGRAAVYVRRIIWKSVLKLYLL